MDSDDEAKLKLASCNAATSVDAFQEVVDTENFKRDHPQEQRSK